MKYVIGMLFILGILTSTLTAQAKVDSYAFTNSTVIYGKLNSKSRLDGAAVSDIKCGYFLTKGPAYRSWGPSLTFFVEDSSGTKDILYRMLNGTRNLDRIESIHLQTADERKIDKKSNTYLAIYRQGSGLLANLIPTEKNSLTIERRLNTNKNYSSQNDINIIRINFRSDLLKRSQLGYTLSTNLSCSFGKEVAKF